MSHPQIWAACLKSLSARPCFYVNCIGSSFGFLSAVIALHLYGNQRLKEGTPHNEELMQYQWPRGHGILNSSAFCVLLCSGDGQGCYWHCGAYIFITASPFWTTVVQWLT
eukprot:TRINITY_DN66844_c1_g1_i1.p2 TRINITY_DN66844_c1_g1~~TRINITY_DN66844_c1_g1_i1.p2  ORF type:complete len:110 (-),score=5.07 TRINITY_DN66844_c1_g1_i1:685-1014(-)